MAKQQFSSHLACIRLRSLGLPHQQTKEMLSVVKRWIEHSGYEWTVGRLKALKLEYVTRLAGTPVLAPSFTRNLKGYPAGVWSWLMHLPNPGKVINALMAYSAFIAPQITKAQKEKFFGTMESRDTTGLNSKLHQVPRVRVPKLPEPRPFLSECCSEEKSGPSVLGTSIRQDDVLGQMTFFASSTPCREAYRRFPLVFDQVVPTALMDCFAQTIRVHLKAPYGNRKAWNDLREACECVGKIGEIQEPGYKLRAVAVCNSVWQAALQPLKRLVLQDLKKNFPSDCTHDQEVGVNSIQSWLKSGKTCFSVDLSDATNLMPRHLQMEVLRDRYSVSREDTSYFQQLVDAFEFVSAQKWYFKQEDGRLSTHRFTRGQPLGLGPSFPTFALAHNLILLGICKKVGCNPWETFRILGDDIVMNNEEVHRRYRATLDNLGAKVSESKTLISNQVAEFAGYVITCDHIIPQYKWRNVINSNFVDVYHNLGPNSVNLLTKDQRVIAKFYASLPEEVGGFGWNPKGVPLSERLGTTSAQWLLERSTVLEEIPIPAQYKTLAIQTKELFSEQALSGLIPELKTDQLSQQVYTTLLENGRPVEERIDLACQEASAKFIQAWEAGELEVFDKRFPASAINSATRDEFHTLILEELRRSATSRPVLAYWNNSSVMASEMVSELSEKLGICIPTQMTLSVGRDRLYQPIVFAGQWLTPQGVTQPGDPRLVSLPTKQQIWTEVLKQQKSEAEAVQAVAKILSKKRRSHRPVHSGYDGTSLYAEQKLKDQLSRNRDRLLPRHHGPHL